MVASKKITGDTGGSRCGCVRDISAFYASFHEKNIPRHVKTACNGRSGVLFVRRGFVRVGCRCAGWLWLAAYVVALSGGLPARQISPDSVRFH
ncbi:hypothetical protein CFA76_15150 [Salmonella enterica]|nr:hypothetical protein [Salmonella enterica]